MDDVNLIGSTLDSKYKIERELGRGGMGTVYLATHIGTSRLVAIKIIMPEFMKRTEFVERFKREAKAAGQLRHPNVVDVTDFGVAKTDIGEVAYLVMEYLDGFTLAQVLKKESNLSLLRTVDILEQVCSAVSEAHQHGIIHRDLKPDNIWLEPNQLGGFTVKVLDFGLVKLNEANTSALPNDSQESRKGNENQTLEIASKTKVQITDTPDGEIVNSTPKEILEKEVLETKLIPNQVDTDDSENKPRTTPDLTKVGTVLGTPLYMSPEQCSGEHLTPQSDIYSLGVIAYEMLSGKPPFNGNYIEVMKSHQKVEPPILESKNAPKKVRNLIQSVLVKNPEERPPTAKAFAAQLRAEATGFGVLLQRSFEISIRHLPTLLPSATLFSLIITLLPVFFSIPTFFSI